MFVSWSQTVQSIVIWKNSILTYCSHDLLCKTNILWILSSEQCIFTVLFNVKLTFRTCSYFKLATQFRECLDIFHDIFPDTFFYPRYRLMHVQCKVQFEAWCLSLWSRQLKGETGKYSANCYLTSEHFDIPFTFSSFYLIPQCEFCLIVCSDCSSSALRPITKI